MTVCVYYKDTLASDTLMTAATNVVSSSYQKIGMIYQDAITGDRSLDPNNLKYPEEFAMYAIAGVVSRANKFLRWFINFDHPMIDHEDFTEEDLAELPEEEFDLEALIIFKDHNIVRLYNSSYINNCFIDQTKDQLTTIGCGSFGALAVHAYDASASSVDIIKAIIKSDIACGGNINVLNFTEESLYNEEEFEKEAATILTENKKPWWNFWKK